MPMKTSINEGDDGRTDGPPNPVERSNRLAVEQDHSTNDISVERIATRRNWARVVVHRNERPNERSNDTQGHAFRLGL